VVCVRGLWTGLAARVNPLTAQSEIGGAAQVRYQKWGQRILGEDSPKERRRSSSICPTLDIWQLPTTTYKYCLV
jgi:hypothetical protein